MLFLGTLVIAIVLPLVLNLTLNKTITGLDQFLIGVLIYVALTLTAQAYHIRRIDASATSNLELWRIKSEFDSRLNNIRQCYYELLSRRRISPEFYSLYFERSLELYEVTINEAVANHELLVDENHLSTTDMLLACFDGRERDIARFTHYFADNDWMFETWAQNYCVQLDELVEQGKLKKVKRLFIYKEDGELALERSRLLMEFHASNPGFEYRAIKEDNYLEIVHDFHMRERFRDFGVYGDWYVYRTIMAVPEHIEGVFSSSERRIKDYQDLFETCFRRGDEPVKTSRPPMTPAELFGAPVIPVSVRPIDGIPDSPLVHGDASQEAEVVISEEN